MMQKEWLYQQAKVALWSLLAVMLLISGCNTQRSTNQHEVIRVGEQEYTRQQMKGYLSEIWQIDKVKNYPFTRWKGKGYEIVYDLSVTDDMDKAFLQAILDERMAYFAQRTGLTFRKPKHANEFVHMQFYVGTDLEKLKQHPNLLVFRDSKEERFQQFYSSLQGQTDLFYRIYWGSIKGIKRPYSIMGLAVEIMDSKNSRDEQRIISDFSRKIAMILLSTLSGKYPDVSETVTTKLYRSPPYIWPLDEVLLDLIYQNKKVNYSGVRREEVIEHLLDEMVKRSGGQ